jgi:tetratricopeptide (TPR) repeat protein
VVDRFPDGQLYLDLRGYDPARPLSPATALATLLRGLGVDGTDLPQDVTGRAARYRTLLAGRRMLVVLDNAHTADQVRPLLPGTPSCLVVVTSRDDLSGLVARDGARRVALDVLPAPEALALLRTLVGERVDADPDAAAALADCCARLPLALRLAAELARTRPDTPLGTLVDDLADQRRRLDLLDTGGDPRAAMRAVFSWSYRYLSPDAARMFGYLGLHPGRDVDAYAVAALAGTSLNESRRLLAELARAHLVEPASGSGPGRYGMHDLLRAYARETVVDAQPARARLDDHVRHCAAVAMDVLYPYERHHRPAVAASGTPVPPLDTPEAALAWLDTELSTVVDVAGREGYRVDMSRILFRYLETGGHYHAALVVHGGAGEAAEVLVNLGLTEERLGRSEAALEHLGRALELAVADGDRAAEARALASLGAVHAGRGRYTRSHEHLSRALAICRETGDRHGEGALLGNLGLLHDRLGRYEEAVDYQRQAVEVLRQTGDRRLEGYALGNLGAVFGSLGRYAEALDHLHRALEHCRAANDRAGIGYMLGDLGAVYRRAGRLDEALEHLGQALATSREIGNRSMETDALNSLGETLHAMGERDAALSHHRAALAAAAQTDNRRQHARALDGIGQVLGAAGELPEAIAHWRDALAIYVDLDLPQAASVRDRLTSAEGS